MDLSVLLQFPNKSKRSDLLPLQEQILKHFCFDTNKADGMKLFNLPSSRDIISLYNNYSSN